jgi:phosphatidylglycerophosphate synthase
MLDRILRPVKERALTPLARATGRRVHPMAVTIIGFACGMTAAFFAARGNTGAALGLWFANRVLDGFDGTLARAQDRQTDIGGYVDIVLDFIVYAAIPLGLVIGTASVSVAVAALAMVGSFYVNAASWMYLAAILERRGTGARARGELTTITMPDGLIGGAETIVFYAAFLAFPEHLVPLFVLMTLLVLVTVGQRLAWATRRL